MKFTKQIEKFDEMMIAGEYSKRTRENYLSCIRVYYEKFKHRYESAFRFVKKSPATCGAFALWPVKG